MKESKMAKLLCFLFLVAFAYQANAFSITTEEPESTTPDDGIIPNIFDPSYWVKKFISNLNPLNYLSKITGFLNPLNWMKKILNPFGVLPDVLNPVNWIRKGIEVFNPLKYIPGFGNDKCALQAQKGTCHEYKPTTVRYYYDQNTKACMQFQFSGCEGNQNNFENKKDCETACRSH